MSAIELQVIPHQTKEGLKYQHLHIQLTTPGGVIEPSDLTGLEIPKNIDWKQGVVIEGKAPIWLYGYLTHECHPAAWVGCYDPRLGAVVVSTHSRIVSVGQVLELDLPA
ncbi:MAG: CRISPR-associated ring nuclease Crn3/Csx3 [Microcoleaceae cyanobacterium]